ncbi:hypothetical protein H2203_002935 [Taxawa tesnikishii (nom. ined.)]|nr:hypothetical protein H2203_002935 [Dothideales sp. JES 119]
MPHARAPSNSAPYHEPASAPAPAPAPASAYARQKQQPALAQISIPSFSSFRAQASSIPILSPIRRKPLPNTASPRATSFSAVASPDPMTELLQTGPNAQLPAQFFNLPGTPVFSRNSAVNAHVEELEKELREVSSELAGSIRREMDLEDEIERCRAEMPTTVPEIGRRTSDYFSDSGASSTRFPLADTDAKMEEMEKSKRKVEQDKAQLRAEYAQKFAEELRQRRDLEAKVHELGEELFDRQQAKQPQSDEQVRELETSLEDARRRLSQERQSKDNFQDLLAALREELEQHRSQRDNLRDEIVPQLNARIEGLEAEISENQALHYENARMQQELQTLREEHQLLLEQKSFAEEDDILPAPHWPSSELSRSASLASRNPATPRRGSSLTRSGSVKDHAGQRAELPSNDRHKELEEQRDALHQTLKNLLIRHEKQKREHANAINKLIAERLRVEDASPRRTAFHREVTHLKEEVVLLRKRADDALEQKWQCEKSIGGVKLALDRAEQETRSLRELLEEHDIIIPQLKEEAPADFMGLGISSRNSHGSDSPLGAAQRESMIEVLRQSIIAAENERDAALREAEFYRERAASLPSEEDDLSSQLLEAANNMEKLAAQVQEQLQSNAELRQRLTNAVAKGEEEQSASTARIVEMQTKLKTMEDRVIAAQQHSETTLGDHEEDVKRMEAANSTQLQRLRITIPSPQRLSPSTPLFSARSPRLGKTSAGPTGTLAEASRTALLEQRVRDLETALAEADSEMKEVVQLINASQYEVAELQGERDEAMRQMRKLQAQILEEREKAQALMA